MNILPWIALLVAAAADEPKTIRVEIRTRAEYLSLPAPDDPATASALRVTRVLDPATGEPIDRGPAPLECALADVRRSFRLPAAEVVLGEPVLVELRTDLDGPGRWTFGVGHNQRKLDRDANTLFLMRHRDGTWASDPYSRLVRRRSSSASRLQVIERGNAVSEWFALQQFCEIDRPGTYDVYALHWDRGIEQVGRSTLLMNALPAEARGRLRLQGTWGLVDAQTGKPSNEFHFSSAAPPPEVPRPSPAVRDAPADLLALDPALGLATDYAHFTLTVRPPAEGEARRAMVDRWIKAERDTSPFRLNRAAAARAGIVMATQDDFLPELERRIRGKDHRDFDLLGFGLAGRDDPRAVALLLDSNDAEAIRSARFLRPTQVAGAVPRLIDLLTSPDAGVRQAAADALQHWTGQPQAAGPLGGVTIPTPDQARGWQARCQAWWNANWVAFTPRDPEEAPRRYGLWSWQ